jgi:hypothetical protein
MCSHARSANTRVYVQTHTLHECDAAETGHGWSLPDASNVGSAVGSAVGERVGDAVGATVGGFVSPRFVGEAVGAVLGEAVGAAET